MARIGMLKLFGVMLLLCGSASADAPKWTYSNTSSTKATLTEVLPEGSTDVAWVFNFNPSAGMLTKGTFGTSQTIDLRAEVMPEGAPAIKSIGDSTFKSCTTLKEVLLPNTLTSIGAGVFRYCSALEKN